MTYEDFRAQAIKTLSRLENFVADNNGQPVTVYLVSALGADSYISNFQVDINLRAPSPSSSTSRDSGLWFFTVDNRHSARSARDHGMGAPLHNRHLVFENRADAEAYLVWAKCHS